MKNQFELNEYGFITNWVVMGPVIEPFSVKMAMDDQLMFEKYMRQCVADTGEHLPKEMEEAFHEKPRYLQSHRNWFVDFSDFYHLTKKIQLNTKTVLEAEEEIVADAVLWTYAAVQVYVNDTCICRNDVPVYKPMKKVDFKLPLKKGRNDIFVRMQNLGVRDTRNIFGIQLINTGGKIGVSLPDVERIEEISGTDLYLEQIGYEKGYLMFDEETPWEFYIKENGKRIQKGFKGKFKAAGMRQITVCADIDGLELYRRIECSENIVPRNGEYDGDLENAHRRMFEAIAKADIKSNHEAAKFYIYPILAKYAVGQVSPEDKEILFQQLDQLELRIDCADFIANGFLRLMLTYDLDEDLKKRARKVLLGFRYWMDEDGEDGMCFWSENHSLLFYESLLLAGKLYPDDIFTRSKKTGKEQYQTALCKINQWLEDVGENGCEEFLSGGYMVVTVAALLNLVDFAPEDISEKAAKVIDTILENLAKHTFKGSMIGPEGRIYRDVIYPFEQGTQGLLHYMNPKCPTCDNVWLAAFASTKYKLPEHLTELMEQTYKEEHVTGNAKIVLNKQEDYMLTSVQSPREDGYKNWYNNSFDESVDRSTFHYTKSINERFHGTTNFEPGVYGYQQHMWYAALDNECVIFSNHPGETADRSSMRPAYWYGNGIFPAVKQQDNCLGVVYSIPEDYPIHFTHLYVPTCKFDEVRLEKNWIFARKEHGYAAVWCSRELIPYDDILFGCEFRSYGSRIAYVCICSSANESGDFNQFVDCCAQSGIEFLEEEQILKAGDRFDIKYQRHDNKTQYI